MPGKLAESIRETFAECELRSRDLHQTALAGIDEHLLLHTFYHEAPFFLSLERALERASVIECRVPRFHSCISITIELSAGLGTDRCRVRD
jgi:hypothetical protein